MSQMRGTPSCKGCGVSQTWGAPSAVGGRVWGEAGAGVWRGAGTWAGGFSGR